MINFLINGGPIFTFPMTGIFLINIILIIRSIFYLFVKKEAIPHRITVDMIKYLGIFLLTVGLLGQIIGLYSAFEAIEKKLVEVDPALMAFGLKISSITTLLGLSYFLISYAAWFLIKLKFDLKQ